MRDAEKINRKNLSQLCHVAGFRGVAGLSRVLKLSRHTVYEAVTEPQKYPLAYPRIIKAITQKHAQVQSN